jgi:hypothetical protein
MNIPNHRTSPSPSSLDCDRSLGLRFGSRPEIAASTLEGPQHAQGRNDPQTVRMEGCEQACLALVRMVRASGNPCPSPLHCAPASDRGRRAVMSPTGAPTKDAQNPRPGMATKRIRPPPWHKWRGRHGDLDFPGLLMEGVWAGGWPTTPPRTPRPLPDSSTSLRSVFGMTLLPLSSRTVCVTFCHPERRTK